MCITVQCQRRSKLKESLSLKEIFKSPEAHPLSTWEDVHIPCRV